MYCLKKIVFLVVAAILISPQVILAQPSIVGEYTVKGANADGSDPYTGVIKVEETKGGYQFVWDEGKDVFKGIGMLNGDLVSVAYRNDDGKEFGIIVYKILDGGKTLDGKWMALDTPESGTEILTKK